MRKIISFIKKMFAKLFGKKMVFIAQNNAVELPFETKAPTIKMTPARRHYTYFDNRLQRTIRKPFAQ